MSDIRTGTISITGLSDLEKRLRELPDRLAKNVMRGAVRAGAVVIQKEARQKCIAGKDAHYLGKGSKKVLIQPGELKKKGIKVRSAPRKFSDFVITYWVYVSKKYWHWKFLEFGTVKMSAKPFLRPAFDTQKEKATEAIRDYMAARIEKELAKIGR
jgi:HK97 gp10 family phage protein